MIRLRVRELLQQRELSKYWLYTRMGISYDNLSRMMNNETRSIRFDNIERLCKLLNCTPNDLFEIDDEPLEED